MTDRVIFDDIVKARDIQEFNKLVRRYLEDQNIEDPEERRRHYWAAFYAWKESMASKI